MPQGLGQAGGLGALGTVLGMHPGEHNAPSAISGLLAVLAQHPGASADLKSSILGSLMSSIAAGQQAHQAAFQTALQQNIDYNMSPNATPEGSQAFMGLTAQGLGPNQQARLQAAAPNLGALLPTSTVGQFTPEDQQALVPQIVQYVNDNKTKGGLAPGDPNLAQSTADFVKQMQVTATGEGKDAQGVKDAVKFALDIYAKLVGIPPNDPMLQLIQRNVT